MSVPEGWEHAGVYYCTKHAGIANEDSDRCDFYEADEHYYDDCVFHACYYNPSDPIPTIPTN